MQRHTFQSPHLNLSTSHTRRYACTLIKAGELKGHGLHVSPDVLQRDAHRFANLMAYVNHSHYPNLERLAGIFEDVAYDPVTQAITGTLTLKDTPAAAWLQRMIDQVIEDKQAGDPALDIGLSADCWISVGEPNGSATRPITAFHHVASVDIVCHPASDGARFERVLAQAQKEIPHMTNPQPNTPPPPAPDHSPPAQDLAAEIAALREQFSALAARQAITGFDTPRPQPITAGAMTTPADHAQAIVDWLFGVQAAALPEPAMRTPRAFYHALTGDFDFHGLARPDRAQFATASTANLADLAANAMNKVLIETWPALEAYRWYEDLVTVVPNDGSVKDMAWISFGGIANLPTVPQGGTYTELNVADTRENDSFAKYGGYVGITLEMWRNNDMQRMQAIPRALAVAAVRTRSEKIASIFTANSGTGPVLDDDSTALFHANHGSNLQTTALSETAWNAARIECYKHAEIGSGKRLGLYPKYCLIPADLYMTALQIFGYGAGPGGYYGGSTAAPNVSPHATDRGPADPRPVPVVVPDWTDTNDWAYLVDPNLHPVLMMSYAQAPGGRTHPMPEIFAVSNPTAGLVFTNDVLPVKVRDWYAYGVATWRGIGKRNVP